MTAHDSFFQKHQPAAVLKHAVLAEYTRVFAGMVGSRQPSLPIWIIDGYAGAGAYDAQDSEGASADGSPLVVLKMAKNLRDRDVRCAFIESSKPIAEALRRNVAPYVQEGLVAPVLEGDVQDRIDEAWRRVGSWSNVSRHGISRCVFSRSAHAEYFP